MPAIAWKNRSFLASTEKWVDPMVRGPLLSEFFISARHQAVCVSMATRCSRTIHPGRENGHDRVAVDPRDCRGKETQGHPQGPSHSLRSRAARAGSRGAIDPRRDGPGRRRGAGGVEPGPGTVRGGGAGDSQAPGTVGPGGRARAEGLRNGATTAERPDRFSGTGRVIDRAWNALRLPFRPQFSTSVPAELSMVSPEPHARSSSGRGYKGEMRPAETGRMMGASVQGNE